MRNTFMRAAVAGVIALAAAFVVLRAFSLTGDLIHIPEVKRPLLLVPALGGYALAVLLAALLWRGVITSLDGARPRLIDSLAVFAASWPGRYVPSALPYVAGKLMLGTRLGHRTDALAGSVVYENVLVVATALVAASVVLPLLLIGEGASLLLYLASGIGGLLALGLLAPPVFNRAVRLAARLSRREVLADGGVLSYQGILSGVAVASVVTLAYGVSFGFILSAFVDLTAREFAIAGAAFALAGAVGIAALPVPSGLGVREAVLVGVMQVIVSVEAAAAAALVMRFGGLIVDIAIGLAGGAWIALRLRADGEAREPEPAQLLDAA